MNHNDFKSSILGGVLSLSYNIVTGSELLKALLMGMVGTLGGWLMTQLIKKFKK